MTTDIDASAGVAEPRKSRIAAPFSWDSWTARALAAHLAEFEAGKHDESCEWRAAGHYLCHCSKRKREADGFTEAPCLVYQSPLCNRCWKPVDHDGDSWRCYDCCVQWDTNGYEEPGEFTDDHGPLDQTFKAWLEHHERVLAAAACPIEGKNPPPSGSVGLTP